MVTYATAWKRMKKTVKRSKVSVLKKHLKNPKYNKSYKDVIRRELKRRGRR